MKNEYEYDTLYDLLNDQIAEEAVSYERKFTPEEIAALNIAKVAYKQRMRVSFVLRDYCESIVDETFPKKERALLTYISNYRDKYIDVLSSPYITKNIFFGKKDEDIVFLCSGLDETKLKAVMKQVEVPPGLQMSGGTVKNLTPFRVAMFFLIRHCIIHKKVETMNRLINYYEYSQYPSIYALWFRNGVYNEAAMRYAVDNMTKKYKLKNAGSVEGMLFQSGEKMTIDTYKNLYIDGSDFACTAIIAQYKNRAKELIKKIRGAYDTAIKSGNVVFVQDKITDDDGNIIELETKTGRIEQYANTYTTKFYSNSLNQSFIDITARQFSVSKSELRATLENMQQERRIDELTLFYTAIFSAFFEDLPRATDADVKGKMFIAEAEAIYKRGNSNDPNIKAIKAISHTWLERGSASYRATTNAGTINYFRKAIYYYFIFSVAL